MALAKLYVGNLDFRASEEPLKRLFAPFGEVVSVNILQGRGFGFVEMANADAARAMQALNGIDFEGRAIKVNEAQARERSGGGSRGGARRY